MPATNLFMIIFIRRVALSEGPPSTFRDVRHELLTVPPSAQTRTKDAEISHQPPPFGYHQEDGVYCAQAARGATVVGGGSCCATLRACGMESRRGLQNT